MYWDSDFAKFDKRLNLYPFLFWYYVLWDFFEVHQIYLSKETYVECCVSEQSEASILYISKVERATLSWSKQ